METKCAITLGLVVLGMAMASLAINPQPVTKIGHLLVVFSILWDQEVFLRPQMGLPQILFQMDPPDVPEIAHIPKGICRL